MDLKRNLDIVLTIEEYKYILTDERPNLSSANEPKMNLKIYKKWFKVDKMARYYILASMSSVLQHQLKDYLSAMDIWSWTSKKCLENKGDLLGRVPWKHWWIPTWLKELQWNNTL